MAVPTQSFSTAEIRNVALVGHGRAGKTSLAEALLFTAGTIARLGSVDDATTVTDFDPEEARRGISVSLALAPIDTEGVKVNLIDTPGYADFIGDVAAALAGGRPRGVRGVGGRGRRGADGGRVADGRGARTPPRHLRQQARS